jgi:hypothetical protein
MSEGLTISSKDGAVKMLEGPGRVPALRKTKPEEVGMEDSSLEPALRYLALLGNENLSR